MSIDVFVVIGFIIFIFIACKAWNWFCMGKYKKLYILGVFLMLTAIVSALIYLNSNNVNSDKPNKTTINNLSSFKFSEFSNDDLTSYEILNNNDIYYYKYTKNGNTNGSRELSYEEVINLYKFLNKSNLKIFNGFNGDDETSNNKEGFILNINYDGEEISATGYNKYPNGYNSFKNNFDKFVNSLD